jgi:O-antigen/teichoic acid export membrane protein
LSGKKLSANFTYNVIGALLPLVVSLGTVPLYIHQIGLARYGVVTITWVLLGYFGFLDFGLSRASANALAKLSTPAERSPVLVTGFVCNLALGVFGGFVLYFVGNLILLHVVKIPGDLMSETRAAYPWMAAMLPLGLLGGVTTGALESREHFLLSNTLSSFGTMAGQAVPLICAYVFGPSLTVVIPATLLVRLFTVLLAYALVIKIEWPLSIFHVSRAWMKKLFGYGSWVTVSSVLNPLFDTSNQLIIGAMLGAASVAIYSVPMNLAMRSQIFATSLSRTLFPRNSRSTHEEAVDVIQRATLSITYGFGMVCAPAILICGPFLKLWIGHRFAFASEAIAQILMFGAWTNGIAFLPYGFLQARGRPNVTAIVGICEVVPFFALLWFMITTLGLEGAAMAWTIRVTSNCVVLYILSGCAPRNPVRLLPAVALMLGSLLAARLIPMSAETALAAAVAVGLVFAGLTYAIDPAAREAVQKLARRAGLLPPPIHRDAV